MPASEKFLGKRRNAWKEKIEQWQASGKNASQWCREHEVPYNNFIYWKQRLLPKASPPQVVQKAPFIELVENLSHDSGIEIAVRGFKLSVSKNFDNITLMRCLKVLESL